MNRLAILLTAILTIVAVAFVGQAAAFNLSWGNGSAIVPVNQTTNGADIPTPQFFTVTAGQPPAAATLSFAPTSDAAAEPSQLHMIDPKTKSTLAVDSSGQLDQAPPVHHLNGPELFLLRQVQTVAER